jgi:hypothetical protein
MRRQPQRPNLTTGALALERSEGGFGYGKHPGRGKPPTPRLRTVEWDPDRDRRAPWTPTCLRSP